MALWRHLALQCVSAVHCALLFVGAGLFLRHTHTHARREEKLCSEDH